MGRGARGEELLILAKNSIAAFVFLASHNLTTLLIKLQCDALLLTFLTLLLVSGLFLCRSASLKDFGFHGEQFIQRDTVLVLVIFRLINVLLRFLLRRSWFLSHGRICHRSCFGSHS